MQMQCVVDDFVLVKSIGKGNFGEVFLTQRKGYPQLYATKKMERSVCERPPLLNRLINEIKILQYVNHPNIVKFIDLKKSMNNWYLVTEYVNGGSLTSNLKKYMAMFRRPFTEDIVQHIMRQIVDALRYLHFNKIIHRDLKLDNILVNFPTEYDKQSLNMKSCQVKIIDFGFATVLDKEFTNTILGTAPNMDPKILGQLTTGVKTEGYNESVDIWSLGTLCYEMVVGCSPFRAQNVKDLYQKVQKGNYIMPSTLSDEIVSFIDSMLQQDSNKRSNAEQLINHKFLTNPVNTFHAVNVKHIKASYLPGGLLNMKSKQPEVIQNANFNYWGIFTQPEMYYGNVQQVVPVQVQPQPQPKIQPKMQMQNVQPQYIAQKQQQNVYYNQPQVNYANYY